MIAQKVEAPLNAPDEGLVRVLSKPRDPRIPLPILTAFRIFQRVGASTRTSYMNRTKNGRVRCIRSSSLCTKNAPISGLRGLGWASTNPAHVGATNSYVPRIIHRNVGQVTFATAAPCYTTGTFGVKPIGHVWDRRMI